MSMRTWFSLAMESKHPSSSGTTTKATRVITAARFWSCWLTIRQRQQRNLISLAARLSPITDVGRTNTKRLPDEEQWEQSFYIPTSLPDIRGAWSEPQTDRGVSTLREPRKTRLHFYSFAHG